jgi:proteic killer suppression protein
VRVCGEWLDGTIRRCGGSPILWCFSCSPVELAFDDRDLREICEDEALAQKKLGTVAGGLRKRLADIRAAGNALELPVGDPRFTKTGAQDVMSLEIAPGTRMILSANHRRAQVDTNGNTSWIKVSRVKLLRIEVSDE